MSNLRANLRPNFSSRALRLRRTHEQKSDSARTHVQPSYCGDKQDPGNPVFFDIDGYHYKGKRLSYASSCIHFDCEAGAGYNKDMKIWQCLDDLNQDSG